MKSRKNQNVWRIGDLQILKNIGNGYNQISGDERKIKNSFSGKPENYPKPNYRAEISSKRETPWLSPL